MKLIIALILFSTSALAMKTQPKHYKLTEAEADSDWSYYYTQELNTGLKNNKIKIEKCYNANVKNWEKLEIPCSEFNKIKSTLDLREITGTEISASAI